MGQRRGGFWVFGRRKRSERHLAAIAETVDAVLEELREDAWTARRFALPGDSGPAMRVVMSPDGDAVFVVAIAERVTDSVVARASTVTGTVATRRRSTAGALGVVVTDAAGYEAGVIDGVLLTDARQLAETLRFEAARLGLGM